MFAHLRLFTYLLQFLAHILHPLKSTSLTHTKEKLLRIINMKPSLLLIFTNKMTLAANQLKDSLKEHII